MLNDDDDDDDDESTMMIINDDDSMTSFLIALRYTSTAFLAMFLAGLFELSFVTPSESEQEEEVGNFVTQPPTCVSKVFGLIFGFMLFIYRSSRCCCCGALFGGGELCCPNLQISIDWLSFIIIDHHYHNYNQNHNYYH